MDLMELFLPIDRVELDRNNRLLLARLLLPTECRERDRVGDRVRDDDDDDDKPRLSWLLLLFRPLCCCNEPKASGSLSAMASTTLRILVLEETRRRC